jgi:ornithine decarboxylase
MVPFPVPLPIQDALYPSKGPDTLCTASLFGPTCDGADVICRDVIMPDLALGDFVAFPKLGAYSWAGACNFNGFEAIGVSFIYVIT